MLVAFWNKLMKHREHIMKYYNALKIANY